MSSKLIINIPVPVPDSMFSIRPYNLMKGNITVDMVTATKKLSL